MTVCMTELFYLQIQKRKTLDKIPIQANFYPLPSMAFLQDKSTRLTLLSSQSNGVASLHQGNDKILALTSWERNFSLITM